MASYLCYIFQARLVKESCGNQLPHFGQDGPDSMTHKNRTRK